MAPHCTKLYIQWFCQCEHFHASNMSEVRAQGVTGASGIEHCVSIHLTNLHYHGNAMVIIACMNVSFN